ncbi:hypothetical protein TDB9533_01070 [Thalassocella blandensis]|nr:hypothetical protein TDB9533_01070 [Thalassocella blandensis]
MSLAAILLATLEVSVACANARLEKKTVAQTPAAETPTAETLTAEALQTASNASSKTVVYNYWYGNGSFARRAYETELIQLLFDLSEDKYGKAEFIVTGRDMSRKRMMKNLKEGKHIQFMVSPYLNKYMDEEAVIVLPYLIFNNLLGYRQLIVNNRDAEKFSSISSKKAFQEKTVGQVVGWGDIDVYKHNKINVLEAPRFSALFSMLEYNRFDYISLGISESKKTYDDEGLAKMNFTLLEDVIVFYPWPVHIMVSVQYPELAERLTYGMKKALDNGMYHKHFNKHYQNVLLKFNRPEVKLIQLETPMLTKKLTDLPVILNKATVLH